MEFYCKMNNHVKSSFYANAVFPALLALPGGPRYPHSAPLSLNFCLISARNENQPCIISWRPSKLSDCKWGIVLIGTVTGISFLLVSYITFYNSTVTKIEVTSSILFSYNKKWLHRFSVRTKTERQKKWLLFPSIAHRFFYTIGPLPISERGRKSTSQHLLVRICFLRLLVFLNCTSATWFFYKYVWLPQGSCLLVNKGKCKRKKAKYFLKLGPIKY